MTRDAPPSTAAPADLDEQIQAAEQAVIERDQRVRRGLRQVVARARGHLAQGVGVGLAIGAGTLLLSRLLPRAGGGASVPPAPAPAPAGGLSLAKALALLWPVLPGGLHAALPRGVPELLFGLVLPALGPLFRRRSEAQPDGAWGQERSRAAVKSAVQVDLSRYLGRWYEIARLPSRFEKRCAANAMATYGLLGRRGGIGVLNQCQAAKGRSVSVRGVARVVEGYGNARLEVSFAPRLLRWLPWAWGDYWVLKVADDYRYALVGTPNRKNLWLLSRTPAMADADLERLLNDAGEQGFDTARIMLTPQRQRASEWRSTAPPLDDGADTLVDSQRSGPT
jgi:apolipoprotein D and lipocalin family protein